MLNKSLVGALILWFLVHLSGCTTVPTGHTSQPHKTPANPVVVSMMDNAQQQERAGQLNRAAASLERALRIEPRDPLLWQRLAKIRLKQHLPEDAVQLATRSNSMVGRHHPLRRDNWLLIAEAYDELGDTGKAESAREKAEE